MGLISRVSSRTYRGRNPSAVHPKMFSRARALLQGKLKDGTAVLVGPPSGFKGLRYNDLPVGKKLSYCTCGLSKNTPWCDGSHRGTEFKPIRFEVPPQKEGKDFHSICQCRQGWNLPFCDGRHKWLEGFDKKAPNPYASYVEQMEAHKARTAKK